VKESEIVGLEIFQERKRYNCWKNIAASSLEITSWQLTLSGVKNYKNKEARVFYLKGWSENIAIQDVTSECIVASLPFMVGDIESMEILLQKYAMQEILLGKLDTTLQQRLNRTLNIQWAINIKNKQN
jgi:hypothetical protein